MLFFSKVSDKIGLYSFKIAYLLILKTSYKVLCIYYLTFFLFYTSITIIHLSKNNVNSNTGNIWLYSLILFNVSKI